VAVTAIVLAGGAADRLGGAAKPYLSVGSRPLISQVLDACRLAGCESAIVVGPEPPAALADQLQSPDLKWTREVPAGGGPARAVAAALQLVDPNENDLALLLAADAPWVSDALPEVLAAAIESVRSEGTGAWAVAGDVRQPLLACVRSDALGALDLDSGGSLYGALAALGLDEVTVSERSVADADTWDDLIALRREVAMEAAERQDQSRLDQWVKAAAETAGVPVSSVDVDAVLDLAREAAHNVERPAAPITTYLLGYAAAANGLDASATAALAEQLAALARSQTPES
jgi:molybdopterin-guanine dinucleotide biosynthesis protein A